MCNYYLLKVSNVLIEISYYTYRKHDPLDELTYFNAAKRQIGKGIKRNNLLLAIFSYCKLPTDYCSISTAIECNFPGCLTQSSNLKFERSRPSNNVQKCENYGVVSFKFIPASALLAMHSIYIWLQLGPAAAPLSCACA